MAHFAMPSGPSEYVVTVQTTSGYGSNNGGSPAPLLNQKSFAGSFIMDHVLVVDDDFSILQVATTILEHSGLRTLSADNGLEALTLLQTHDIDVLLTDLVMPGMSGAELIVEARRLRPDLPVCCMTAYNPVVDLDLESVLIISKPFVPRKLINAVRQVLETRSQGGTYIGGPSSGFLSRCRAVGKSRNLSPKPFCGA
jgi:CheY-like chemotaxis protein